MQKPITYERADDANCRVRNKIESLPLTNPTGRNIVENPS